jgi:2-polyprenyl-6-methoxyphenol hydroxylase-like FAD-dependent oxidoreductase
MTSPLPIEIVGGGLAGLALGLGLVKAGVPATVFEAGGYPRHRVCGEFISGLDDGTVERLGIRPLLADSRPHRSVTYFLRRRALRPYALPAPAWGISRHALDSRLAQAFVGAGGDLRTQTRGPEDEAPPGRVFAAGRRRKGPFWVGLKVHVAGLALANDFEVHLGDRAYVGLSRIETGAVNVCGIFAHRPGAERGPAMLLAYLEACGLSALAGRLRAAGVDPATFCVTAATLGDRRVAPADRIWIGDACATIAPFTGNGLAMALQGADLAVPPLVAYSQRRIGWAETVHAIGAAQRRRFRRRLRAAALLHPFFLQPGRQSVLAALVQARLIPFRTLFAVLH